MQKNKKQEYGIIYKSTNKINGKTYIGQTINFEKRITEHEKCYEKDDCIFHRAIQKYGRENFKWDIIDIAYSKEELNKLEKKYIKEYNSYVKFRNSNGYNMTLGGEGGSMWNARPIVCLDLDGKFISRYNSASEAEKLGGYCNSSILTCCKNKNKIHKKHLFMFEEDYLKNGGYKYEKPKLNNCKGVKQYDLNGNFIDEYPSITEASKKTNTRRASISGCLAKKYKQANGYMWCYNNEYIESKIQPIKGRHLYQIDINSKEIINEFTSIAEAGRFLDKNYKSIHKTVNKIIENECRNATCFGYIWVTNLKNIIHNQEIKAA